MLNDHPHALLSLPGQDSNGFSPQAVREARDLVPQIHRRPTAAVVDFRRVIEDLDVEIWLCLQVLFQGRLVVGAGAGLGQGVMLAAKGWRHVFDDQRV